MKTVRNVGLLTAAAALAFTFTPVFGFSRANADEGILVTDPPATTQDTQSGAASPGNASTTGTASSSNPGALGSGSSSQDTSGASTNSAASLASQTNPSSGAASSSGTGLTSGSASGSAPSTIETKEVDGIKIPVGTRIPVINPFYLLSEESNAITDTLKQADSGQISAVEIEDKGKVTVSYSNGAEKKTNMKNLVEAGFINFKTSVNDSVGADAPPLPKYYNGGVDCTQTGSSYNAGSVALFRDDFGGKALVSMKLENHPGYVRAARDMVVYANSVGQVEMDSAGNPVVDLKDDGSSMAAKGSLKGFKIRSYQYEVPKDVDDQTDTNKYNISKVPDEDFRPYRFYTLKTKAESNDRIAMDARLGKHEITYTVHRNGNPSEQSTGVLNVRVLPLKEKFEPVVTHNSKANPLQLSELRIQLPWDKAAEIIGFDVVDGANSVREKEPNCPLGGKEPSCYGLQAGKRLDLLKNVDGLNVNSADDSQTKQNLRDTKFMVDSDITSTEPGLAPGIHKVRIKVIYPDNQTASDYLRGNPDGDSVDYVDLYVKLPIPLTPLTPAQPIPSPNPQPAPQPVPDVIPGGGNDSPGGSYVPVTFDPKGDGNTGGGNDKPAPREPEAKKTPNVTETPSSGTNKVNDPEPTPVEDPNNLIPEEKQKIREAVKKSNPNLGLDDDKIHIADNGEITIYLPDDSVVKIPPVKGVSLYPNPRNPGAPSGNQPAPVSPTNKLPNTGVDAVPVIWVSTALSLAGTLLTLRSRKLARCRVRKH